MNQLIKEMLEEATLHGVPQMGIDDDINHMMLIDLVVKRCTNICYEKAQQQAEIDNVVSGHKERAYMDVFNTINQAFGITSNKESQ